MVKCIFASQASDSLTLILLMRVSESDTWLAKMAQMSKSLAPTERSYYKEYSCEISKL